MMNHIEIKKQWIPAGYEHPVFLIDGRPLYEYIKEWTAGNPALSNWISPPDILAICWTDGYDCEGDARFMRFVLNQEQAITPILSCPEDFDFSCVVLVAEVERQENQVLWKRMGVVDHSAASFEEEKQKGILWLEAYSEEDWVRFGDNIALETVDSPKWYDWIRENWPEELYRRRIHYTFPYYQNEHHIQWFASCNFVFDRGEYDALVAGCYADIEHEGA